MASNASCLFRCCAIAAALSAGAALADPWAPPGDMLLRHDLQLLADNGLLTAPLTTWPVSWGDIAGSLNAPDDPRALPPALGSAFARVQRRLRLESRTSELDLGLSASVAEEPIVLRNFADTPREEGEVALRMSWMGKRFAARLQVAAVDDPQDGKDTRFDGSYLGMALGNWMLSASALPRWWGPGWDGSLILGTAARPVPALVLERNRSLPFDFPVLRWLGPWKFVAFVGQLESERHVPDAKLIGMRFTIKPTEKLEFGASRTAQWGGEGRPEDWDSFIDMLLGKDNVGQSGVTLEREPGNQIAGFDVRWQSPLIGRLPYALYAQFIGEDHSGNLPAGYIGLAGLEHWGSIGSRSYRVYLEAANTMSSFYDSNPTDGPRPNYAYEHHIYKSGYRYYGRPLGHAADNDSRVYSLGLVLAGRGNTLWTLQLQHAQLNYDDSGNGHTLSPGEEAEVVRGLITYRRPFVFGEVEFGLGAERFESASVRDTEPQAFLRWSVNWR